ncbi:MAG: putative lipid II flippase FtsW [Acidobacteria bacterium]|nr:putative lipid II flippase FtsW [Acidobacteriota bacterium]
MAEKAKRADWMMFVIACALALFGAMMVYSASAMMAMRESAEGSQYTYFFKQLIFVLIGIAAMYVLSRIDYHIFNNRWIAVLAIAVTAIALASVFFFPPINGARRWIRFGGLSFQPSELAKIALPLFFAWFLTKNEGSVGELKKTLLWCIAALGPIVGLLMLQKDLGTTIVLCIAFGAVYYSAGAKYRHIGVAAGAFLVLVVGAILVTPYRMARVMAFLDPYKYADDEAYQVVQSLYAIGSGGITGEGFAMGQQKLFYLPYPFSDFIFSVVGEELGLIGTLAVVVAFAVLLWRGSRAALGAPDRFGMLLGIGLITGIIAQALFNISVVISIVPAKGIPLPFISYGGSSVVLTLAAIGILLSISRYVKEPAKAVTAKRPTRSRVKGAAAAQR